MTTQTIIQLNQLNTNFYNKIGKFWNQDSDYFWEGWHTLKSLMDLPKISPLSVLDIGCGNGRFATFASQNLSLNQPFSYLGLDSSSEMLSFCPKIAHPNKVYFKLEDVVFNSSWSHSLNQKFNLVVLMGLMHHIPSSKNRLKLIQQAAKCVEPGGYLCFTTWRFDLLARLQKRVVDLSGSAGERFVLETGIDKNQFEKGDAILDWTKYDQAYRFSHQYSESEIDTFIQVIKTEKMDLIARYFHDGKECKRNEYFVFRKIKKLKIST